MTRNSEPLTQPHPLRCGFFFQMFPEQVAATAAMHAFRPKRMVPLAKRYEVVELKRQFRVVLSLKYVMDA